MKYLSFIIAIAAIVFAFNKPATSTLATNYRGTSISSAKNSSTSPLASGATFTGTGEQNAFPQVGVMVKTDNSGTLYFDFSSDGENWDSTFPTGGFKVSANIPDFHTAVKLGRYFRVRFVNDTGDQSFLRLTTYYGEGFLPSATPINQAVSIDNDAVVVRPTIAEDEVLTGVRTGVSFFTKFGYRSDLTAANGEETIWAASGNFTPMATADTFTVTYNSSNDGSSSTGALTLYCNYVDSDGLAQVASHTLGSDGSDTTSFTGLGFNRCAVSSSGTSETNVSDITLTSTDEGYIQAFIPAGEGATQQAIFHTDSNSFGVAKYLWVNTNKLSGGSAPRVTIKGYVHNRNVATRFEIFRLLVDTNTDTVIAINEPVGFRLTPTDVLYFVADTDTNNTSVNIRFSLREYKQD